MFDMDGSSTIDLAEMTALLSLYDITNADAYLQAFDFEKIEPKQSMETTFIQMSFLPAGVSSVDLSPLQTEKRRNSYLPGS